MNKENKVFCVISHTHWDREWYMPIENFRHRLIDLFDHLLDIVEENPNYIFHMDSQTVVLEDYLLVRPEKKDILKKHISNRRIIIGPWYLANDFYLTSGESTVRNLLEGKKLCREFGSSGKIGYAADQFGNASQIPQILKGFGIDNFVFGRGFADYTVNKNGDPVMKTTPTEFIWKGADGTEVLAVHMRHWYNNAQRFSADIDRAYKFLQSIEKLYDNEFTATPYILLMNGVDHLEPQGDIIQISDELQKRLDDGKYILQYNMDDYIDDVKKYIADNDVKLKTVEGELRKSWDITVLQGTLSSRHYLKIMNNNAQILLENQLEPLFTMMERNGMKGIYPYDQLVYSWKNLMKNHPHDSICGCSHDGVHHHMENRYEELFEFGGELLRRGLKDAAEHMAAARSGGDKEYIITVANTSYKPVCGITKAEVKILVSDELEKFKIVDSEGNDVLYNVISKQRLATNVFSPINLPGQFDVFKYSIYIDVGEIQPFSFKNFIITESDSVPKLVGNKPSKSVSVSNGILTVSADKNGKLSIENHSLNRKVKDFFKIEDMADAGDSYGFVLAGDKPIYSDSFKVETSVVENNDFVSTLRAKYTMNLPEDYNPANRERTKKTVKSTLIMDFTLKKHSDVVEVGYTLNNNSKSHRLRLVFDTDIDSRKSYADIPFDIVNHTNDDFFPKTNAKTSPNSTFAAMCDGKKGFAVFTIGAHEYEHVEPNRLLFTVCRATGTINGGGSENWVTPDNQCIRTISGKMGVCLFKGNVVSADIPAKSLLFRSPLLNISTSCDTKKFAGGRPCVQDSEIAESFYLPDKYPAVSIADNDSTVTVTGKGLFVSALKKSEDQSGYIIRFVNLSNSATTAKVNSGGKIFKTRLDEVPREFIGIGKADLPVGAKEIVTLFIE